MYGAPNSIEAHPGGVAQPYEVWHYREIKEFGAGRAPNRAPRIDKTDDRDQEGCRYEVCRRLSYAVVYQLQPARNE